MIHLTILGQPCSKANSRQIVTIKGRPTPIKSKVALTYERDALAQIPPRHRVRLEGPLAVRMILYYRSELSDLDESLVLDVLQDRYKGKGEQRQLIQAGVYRNDRQVREKHIQHAIDKQNPRAEIWITPLVAQQDPLELEESDDQFAMEAA